VDEKGYRTFVGKLLYAIMKVIPDCCNAIQDLTSHLSKPRKDHWDALSRLMGHLKGHYRSLKLREPMEIQVMTAYDADWATDKNDRKSISSILMTIGGTSLVNFQSKKQPTVALSTCEAETMAGTVAGQDTMFENNLLEELLGHKPKMPSYIYGDNAASLFLAMYNHVGQRTKHIDLRHRFMADLVERGIVELRHVNSEDNPVDINSKNVRKELHLKHRDKIYEGLILAYPIEEDVEQDVG